MRNEINRNFRRGDPVTVLTGGAAHRRRGIILAVDRSARVFTDHELLRCGGVETPLYRYLGDAEELLSADAAVLEADGVRYRMLHAEPVTGFSGKMYIQAILERQVQADDGQ